MLTLLAYAVLGIFFIGFGRRLWIYSQAPAPLLIPTTPAPVTRLGVMGRLFREVVFFESLFKGDKLAWIASYLFHGALAVVLIRHIRYFVDPLPALFAHFQIFGILAGLAMVGGLGLLFLRRLVIDRVRYISSPSDYLVLLLLIGIGVTGLAMTFLFRPDIVTIKEVMTNLFSFSSLSLPLFSFGDALFILHLSLVGLLLVIFPFSKLMHMGGIFFSPTRNQVDNPREVRHVNPWDGQK
ncbi:MAG: respiratory nitrate reductase subunit gamma [Magnetococcales bacterium]|nr:respiratory nitrate reductase subunit gamma [Magnetococcales bacterium]